MNRFLKEFHTVPVEVVFFLDLCYVHPTYLGKMNPLRQGCFSTWGAHPPEKMDLMLRCW